jgi:ABC-type transport system substrate-binding protein
MQLQALSASQQARKAAFDRVQQIVADQQPLIYLIYPNVLQAVSPQLHGVLPSIHAPGPVANIDSIRRENDRQGGVR